MTTRETQHPNTDDNTQGFGGSLGNWDLVMLGSVEELVKVFNTNIETGLTDDQVSSEVRGGRTPPLTYAKTAVAPSYA